MITASRPHFRTLQGFLKWQPEDHYKYEWNKGKVEKSNNMKQLEFVILSVLYELFYQKGLSEKGKLITEGDVMTSAEQLRRPDMAYYTNEQIMKATQGNNQVPAFVIEIISTHDNQIQVASKVQEYFLAGVAVVWLIMPAAKQVYIYNSAKKSLYLRRKGYLHSQSSTARF